MVEVEGEVGAGEHADAEVDDGGGEEGGAGVSGDEDGRGLRMGSGERGIEQGAEGRPRRDSERRSPSDAACSRGVFRVSHLRS